MPKTPNALAPKLGLIAGSGSLPLYIAERAKANGRDIFVFGIDGTTPKDIEAFDHCWVKWGEIDKLFKKITDHNIKELVIIGGVRRPNFKNIKFDFGFIRNLPFVLSLTMGGDDEILSSIIDFIENKGIKIIGAHEIAPELTEHSGTLTTKKPTNRDLQDIEKGIRTVKLLGAMDVGQAAVVARDHVLCVEAAEGTDAMLKRAEGLRQWGTKWLGRKFGVLVKIPKPNQEMRIDMPTIGPKTIENIVSANLAGLCIASGSVLIADKDELIELANNNSIFVISIDPEKFLENRKNGNQKNE